MDYICKTKCFYRKRIWNRGEAITFSDKVDKKLIPPHFIAKSKYVKDVKLTRREEDIRAAQAVGHEAFSSQDDDILS